ncbi:MAG: hypothetical protein EU532_01230, partial [Promethearchaeota archaeon]
METIKKYTDTCFQIIPGSIYGLISVSLTFLFVFLSYIHFPGYNILYNDISVLGIGPGVSAPLFNNGLKIVGIIAIPFFIYLGKILKQTSNNIKMINRAVKLSIMGCLSLSLIGFFPVINFTMSIIHAGLALIFFLCSMINLVIFSITILKDQRFSNLHSHVGFIIAGLIAFYIAVRWSLVEWIVFFALGFWIIDLSIY